MVSTRYLLLGHTTYKHILGWRRREEQSTKSAAFTIAPIHSYTPSQRKAITHHDPEGISPCHHSVFPSPSIVTMSNVLTAKKGKIANLSCRSRVDSVRTAAGTGGRPGRGSNRRAELGSASTPSSDRAPTGNQAKAGAIASSCDRAIRLHARVQQRPPPLAVGAATPAGCVGHTPPRVIRR